MTDASNHYRIGFAVEHGHAENQSWLAEYHRQNAERHRQRAIANIAAVIYHERAPLTIDKPNEPYWTHEHEMYLAEYAAFHPHARPCAEEGCEVYDSDSDADTGAREEVES